MAHRPRGAAPGPEGRSATGLRSAHPRHRLGGAHSARTDPWRPNFLVLNSLDDLLTLRRRRAKLRARGRTPRWAIIGGGLIGCEFASDLHKAGDAVTIFHREPRLIELQLTESQSQALHEHFIALGIEVRYRQDVNVLSRGFDGVIVSTGFAPRVDPRPRRGLATARGIVVDDILRTADPAIYAVGRRSRGRRATLSFRLADPLPGAVARRPPGGPYSARIPPPSSP